MGTGSTGTIILAAGDSTRMGTTKALLRIEGRTFIEQIHRLHLGISKKICIILGRQADVIRSRVKLKGAVLLRNPRPEEGPLSSIRIGLRELEGSTGVIIHAVDQPLVRRATIRILQSTHSQYPDAIIIPCRAERRGHPVLFPSGLFPDLLRAPLDVGARWVVRQNPGAVRLVEVDDPGILENINTPEDWKRIESRRSTVSASDN